ncbi:MAG: general stress protein [Bdellovibrionia bacterium]
MSNTFEQEQEKHFELEEHRASQKEGSREQATQATVKPLERAVETPKELRSPETELEARTGEKKEQHTSVAAPTLLTQPQQPTQEQAQSAAPGSTPAGVPTTEVRPVERAKVPGRTGARGTAAMDPQTRKEVARKGGLAVSRNKQHMAEIGRKGGQSVSKNREHMAQIGRKGGAASRGHR